MEQLQSDFTVRKIRRREAQSIRALYMAMGRDGDWAASMSADALFCSGEWWGLYDEQGVLLMCIARSAAQSDMAQAVCINTAHQGIDLPRQTNPQVYWLPPAFAQQAQAAAGAFVRALAQYEQTPVLAALAVKSGTSLLSAYFSAGMVLWSMRPLQALRPHYLWVLTAPPAGVSCGLIGAHDTFALSRALEQGQAGTGIWCVAGEQWICFTQKDGI